MTGDAGWQGAYTAFLGPDPLALLFVVILTSLGTWGLPQMVGKFYAIKSEKDIHKGTVISTVFAIIVAGGCYFLGGFGRLYADKVTINPATGKPLFDTIVPTMLSHTSGTCHSGGHCACIIRIYVHPFITGADIKFYIYTGCDQACI